MQTDAALVRKVQSQQLMFASHAMLHAHSREPMFAFADDALKLAHLDSLFGVCRQLISSQPFRFGVLAANAPGIAEYIGWKHGAQAEGKIIDEATFNGRAASASIETIKPALSIANSHYMSRGLPEMLEALCAEPWAPQSLSFAFCDVASSSFESLCAEGSLSSELGRGGSADAKLGAACQIDAALRLLRPGASLVLRLGDCLTRWSVGLVYLLYRSFKRLRIVKPFSSSPLDPERFIVCSGFIAPPADVFAMLDSVKRECRSGADILSVVPIDRLIEHDFNSFVTRANDRFMRRELDAWKFARTSSTCADELKTLGADALALVNCSQARAASPLNTNAKEFVPQFARSGSSFSEGESASAA